MTRDVRVFGDAGEVSRQAARAVADTIDDAVQHRSRCALVLSGGSTPRMLYTLLASQFRDRIPWPQVHVFWGDERYVPPDDPRSNYRMAKEALLDHVPCPAANIHPMPTGFSSADDAAREYERTLFHHGSGDWPRFDLVLLGLGEDGHTASLFPGSPALDERTRAVVAVEAAVDPAARLTLTPPAFARAGIVYFLVTGPSKRQALRDALAATPGAAHPAARIRPEDGEVIWWVDRDAADGRMRVTGSRNALEEPRA